MSPTAVPGIREPTSVQAMLPLVTLAGLISAAPPGLERVEPTQIEQRA
ncbi:MAG: hypothetical protein ACXWXO_17550 [Nocardioides sp.]